MVAERVVSPVFIGRGDALAALVRAWRTAREQGLVVALVVGEAGIGKSRLLTEFARTQESAVRVVRGGCTEFGGEGLAYAPFVAVLRELIRDAAAPAGGYRELARWFPELGATDAAGTGKHRLYEEILALIERAAAVRPFVLAVEDLHWADAASRELFAFLARNLTRPGVLLLATHRPGGTDGGQLGALLAELARGPRTSTVRLLPLAEADVARQLAAILGSEPDAATVHRVHRRSDGNPLFVEALAHGGARTPDSLRELLLRGPRSLPSAARRLLGLVSAGGDRVAHRLLEQVAEEGGAELDALLRPLVDQGLLVTSGDGYAFRHALIRQAVYEDLLPGERSRLHARYAKALGSGTAGADSDAAGLAAHAYAAGDHVQALAVAYRAAGRARRSYAYGEQRHLLERVIELWERVPDPSAGIGTDLVGVLTEAAEACMLSGAYPQGVDHAAAGLAVLGAGTAPERAALLLEHRGRLRHRLDGSGIDDFEHALRLLPEEVGNVQRGRVLGVLAMGLPANTDRARWAFDEALRSGRRTEDATVTVRGLLGVGALTGDLAALAEARTLAEGLAGHDLLMTVPMYEAMVLTRAGDHLRGAEVALDGIRRARRFGLGLSRGADLACFAVHGLTLAGRWDEAAVLLEEALAEGPPPSAHQHLRCLGGHLALLRGEVAAAADAAAGPSDALHGRGLFHHYQLVCHLALAQGEVEGAVRTLHLALGEVEGADRALGRALDHPEFPHLNPGEARSFLVTGALVQEARLRRGSSTTATDRARTRRTELVALDARFAEDGRLDRAWHVYLHALLHDEGWPLAVDTFRELRQPYHLAQCLLYAGRSALAADDLTTGAARLDEAAELAASLGAPLLHRQIALASRPAAALPAGLTSREHEVLALVAQGLSNRQIAGRLHISPSTAGVHVSHILTKLGATTRTQAAAIAHQQGLTTDLGVSGPGGRVQPGDR